MAQLSHLYMTTGKTIALTRQAFVDKVMSLLFNMLSRLLIDFSSKEQVSFNFMAKVTICSDFAAPKIKSVTVSIVSLSNWHEVMVNKTEVDVYLEPSWCFNDPADVGNWNSGSSAFSKTSLNIWKFTVHLLLKPDLENFEH